MTVAELPAPAAESTLDLLTEALLTCRNQMRVLGRRHQAVLLELEEVDSARGQAQRRLMELSAQITELELRGGGNQLAERADRVVDYIDRRGACRSAEVVTTFQISGGYAYFLLKRLTEAGRIVRLERGLFGSAAAHRPAAVAPVVKADLAGVGS